MACKAEADPLPADLDFPPLPKQPPAQFEYDFIEQPPQDFFCPVTLELLVQPHQTTCCGNHLSQEAAERLKNDGKPCPMCKEPQLGTIPDKYMKRRVNNVRVHCSFKASGCEWEGEVSNLRGHVDSCPKRPWHCEYCDYQSTYETGTSEHVVNCTKFPVVCPNSCEIGSVPRGEVKEHLMVCPLQPVMCEYAEVGCDVKVPRRDLFRHLEEAQQQHLLSATLFNVQLTQEKLAEKDKIIAEKDAQLKEKDHYIAGLQLQLMGLEKKVTTLQQGVEKLNVKSISTLHSCYTSQGYTCHNTTIKGLETITYDSEWLFEFSSPEGYDIQFCILSKGEDGKCTHISILPRLLHGDNYDKLAWPVEINLYIIVLNQLGDHDHHVANGCVTIDKGDNDFKFGIFPSFIASNELGFDAEKNTQYLKDNYLKLQVYIKYERNARRIYRTKKQKRKENFT